MRSTQTPSTYQLAVFDHVAAALELRRRGEAWRDLVVVAVPGAGKTWTTVESCRRTPRHRSVVVAFGRRVKDELQARLPSSARAQTLNGLGYAAWRDAVGDVEVASNKLDRIARKAADDNHFPQFLRRRVVRLAELGRMYGIVPGSTPPEGINVGDGAAATASRDDLCVGDTLAGGALQLRGLVADVDAAWLELIERHDLKPGDAPGRLVAAARDVLRKSIRTSHQIIDFGDQVYLPTLAVEPYLSCDADVLYCDELQDLDHLQRRMIVRLVRGNDRCRPVFVGVGDPKQAIFSFRGAESDSMQRLRRDLDAIVLPLSICYRCPTTHLAAARRYSPRIEAAPGAAAGLMHRYDDAGTLSCVRPWEHPPSCYCVVAGRLVGTVDDSTPPRLRDSGEDFRPGDVVVCRARAPLVRAAFWLWKRKVPARILGREIGGDILSFVENAGGRASTLAEMVAAVERVTSRAVVRHRAQDDVEAAAEASDRRDVVAAVARSVFDEDVPQSREMELFRRRLEDLFGDDEDRESVVLLATVHKFKGGEADRMWWLDPDKPDPANPAYRREWQRVEAANLRLVALTRSRSELRLMPLAALGEETM